MYRYVGNKQGGIGKLGGLDLSRCRHWQKVNLDSFKKLVLTIDKSRSRYLNFVSTSPSSPKSLDQEIRPGLKFLVNLDSLSQSRISWFYHFRDKHFSIFQYFWAWSHSKSLDFKNLDWNREKACLDRLRNLDLDCRDPQA